MNKVKAYLQGGLGNQCFIYSAARAVALSKNCDVLLDLDYLIEDKIYKRTLSLGQFDCVYEIAEQSQKICRVLKKIRYVLLRDLSCGGKVKQGRIGNYCWDSRPFRFRRLPLNWEGTLTLDGYWQSEKYFHSIREQLLADFHLKDDVWIEADPVARQICAAEDSVFLHVRSYKEVPGKEDGQCAQRMVDYYRKAITYIIEHIGHPIFFIFSDDISFARELLSSLFSALNFQSYFYVENLMHLSSSLMEMAPSDQIRDFTLMRMCKHGILADSSFSWWAGWLGEQERLLNDESPIRVHVNRRVMNDDFWPERWVAIDE